MTGFSPKEFDACLKIANTEETPRHDLSSLTDNSPHLPFLDDVTLESSKPA